MVWFFKFSALIIIIIEQNLKLKGVGFEYVILTWKRKRRNYFNEQKVTNIFKETPWIDTKRWLFNDDSSSITWLNNNNKNEYVMYYY